METFCKEILVFEKFKGYQEHQVPLSKEDRLFSHSSSLSKVYGGISVQLLESEYGTEKDLWSGNPWKWFHGQWYIAK